MIVEPLVLHRATQESHRRRAGRVHQELPVWPVYLLFAGYPLWWLLGVGAFAVIVVGLPMALLLSLRGGVRVPRPFGLWVVFVAFVLGSVTQIDSALRLIGFATRAANYLGVTVLFVYLVNISPVRLPTDRLVRIACAYWAVVVAGGYLGVLNPRGRLTTPLSHLLPGGLLGNDYVNSLVLPHFAEVQQPYGAPAPFYRPSAPLTYTNSWGCAYALGLPLVLYTLQRLPPGWQRRGLVLVLAASLVPAVATLNRGMFLAVVVALGYTAVRAAVRGQAKLLVVVIGAALLVATVVTASGAVGRVSSRTSSSDTNQTRQLLYQETFDRTLSSPLLGFGAPRPSENQDVSVGTQGQVWNVMFSYGFVALVAFVGWFWYLAWRTRRAQGTMIWIHTGLLVISFTIFYYGYDGMAMAQAMLVGACGLRPDAERNTEPRP